MMDEATKLSAYLKMGFHPQKAKTWRLSCAGCPDSIIADECKIVESDITNSRFFKQRIQLLCPKCDSLITGADM